MGKKKLFTDEQENFILNNYKTMSNEQIAQYFGNEFTRSQVNSWLLHRGIKRNGQGCIYKNRIFSKEDSEFIINNYQTMTYNEIAKILGFTEKQIRGKANYLDLPTKRKYVNYEYFKNIDTPLKAYFIGFIFADGWIVYNENTSSYEFGMELQSGDRYILDKLNEVLGDESIIRHICPKDILVNGNQIAHSGHSDVLRVNSKDLVINLMKNGISTNKTLNNIYPIVDDSLFFDFLRGYIDGDGCFYTDNGQTYIHITCATIDVLQYIQNKLNVHGIKTQIYTENERKHRLMCTSFNEMSKLVNRLYYKEGLFCLERKYNKIKHFLGFAA